MKTFGICYAFDRSHPDSEPDFILISKKAGPNSLVDFVIGLTSNKFAFTGHDLDCDDSPFEGVLMDENSRSFLNSL